MYSSAGAVHQTSRCASQGAAWCRLVQIGAPFSATLSVPVGVLRHALDSSLRPPLPSLPPHLPLAVPFCVDLSFPAAPPRSLTTLFLACPCLPRPYTARPLQSLSRVRAAGFRTFGCKRACVRGLRKSVACRYCTIAQSFARCCCNCCCCCSHCYSIC